MEMLDFKDIISKGSIRAREASFREEKASKKTNERERTFTTWSVRSFTAPSGDATRCAGYVLATAHLNFPEKSSKEWS